MFDKKKDNVHEKEQHKTAEQKAKEAKAAHDAPSSANKSEVEKSFGDDQQHRYDPKDLEKGESKAKGKEEAKGVPPSQSASGSDDKADVHLNIERERKEQVSKDYSKEIKIGSLVYEKPKADNGNVGAGALDGRPWTVMSVNEGQANCLIMNPTTNRQQTEVFKLSDLMTEEPK